MKLFLSALIFSIVAPLTLQAQPAPDTAELTKLLNEFLAGASRNDAAMHDRFWADDLIYTGSGGRRRGKADVMRDVASAPAPKPGDPRTTYTAEEVRIQQYGDTAIVAFRLVGTTEKDGTIQVSKFLNSGTFLKRNGKWQVVNWQATRIPRPEADARKDLATAEAAFQRAALSGDLKTLESLLDQNFVWMHGLGEQVTRQQYLDDFKAGRLKYSRLETNNVTVSVSGDTGVVRGVSVRQRGRFPGDNGSGDTAPFKTFYTVTVVNQGGDWKAVAMHSTRLDM